MLEELNIPQAEDKDDALLPAALPIQPQTADFASATQDELRIALEESSRIDAAALAADDALEQSVLEPIARMLAQAEREGKSLADVQVQLVEIVGQLDNAALIELTRQAHVWSFTQGYVDQTADNGGSTDA